MSKLVEKFREYSVWRSGVVTALERYRDAADAAALVDESSDPAHRAHAVPGWPRTS